MRLHGWTMIPLRYLQFQIIHENKHKESMRFELKKLLNLLSICSNINLLGILNFGMALFKFQITSSYAKENHETFLYHMVDTKMQTRG
jgi:formate/nitrite transporter FocA (FNT family)